MMNGYCVRCPYCEFRWYCLSRPCLCLATAIRLMEVNWQVPSTVSTSQAEPEWFPCLCPVRCPARVTLTGLMAHAATQQRIPTTAIRLAPPPPDPGHWLDHILNALTAGAYVHERGSLSTLTTSFTSSNLLDQLSTFAAGRADTAADRSHFFALFK